jgi:hypothetical protein
MTTPPAAYVFHDGNLLALRIIQFDCGRCEGKVITRNQE